MELPSIGIGTAHIKADEMEEVISTAVLSANVFHIDCAKVYGNEESVGKALKKVFDSGKLARDKVFITSKLWNDDHRCVEQACRLSLSRLGLECLDLYLIHWPSAWKKGTVLCPDDEATLEQTWRDMESLVDLGLTKRIGISNFDETNVKRILAIARIQPYANQLEIHPMLAQRSLVKFNKSKNIHVVAWSPLAKFDSLARVPTLVRIAEKKGKSVVQIVLRWHYQHGVATIPRSSKPSRIISNAAIFDFELTDDDMEEIDNLDENKRLTIDWIGVFDTTDNFPYRFPIRFIVSWLFRFIFFFVPNKIDLMGNPFAK